MLIRTRKSSEIKSSEITPESIYQGRRKFLSGGAALALGLNLPEAWAGRYCG